MLLSNHGEKGTWGEPGHGDSFGEGAEEIRHHPLAGSIAQCRPELGLVLSSPLLSRGFTACGREGSSINSAEQERSALKTQTEWKDLLARPGPAPCSQAPTAFLQPQPGHQPKPLRHQGLLLSKQRQFLMESLH